MPVNFNPVDKKWCSDYHPALFHRAIEQMQMVATHRILSNFKDMNNSKHVVLLGNKRCRKGWSFKVEDNKCQPISAFALPVYMWQNDGVDYKVVNVMPNLRSPFPSGYLSGLKAKFETDGQNQNWKSIYQTRYNPPLSGRSMHHNPGGGHSFQAPRPYHHKVSLELSHNKLPRVHETTNFSKMLSDQRLQSIADSYCECMRDLRFENYNRGF